MDIAILAGKLVRAGAPILGGALGGSAGEKVTKTVIDALADQFGVPPTSEAVGEALGRQDAPTIVKRVEGEIAPGLMEELNALLADRKDARAATGDLLGKGSPIAWGAPVVSFIVMIGFAIVSYLAIFGPQAQREVLMYLLAAWQSLATGVAGYWLGSSAGSKAKDQALERLVGRR